MANSESEAKVKLTAENKTDAAFRQVGENLQKLNSGTGNLSSSLKTLGLAGAALYVGSKLFDYFKEGIQLALDDEVATMRLSAALNTLGEAYKRPELDFFVQQMVILGQQASTTEAGLTKLIQTTKDTSASMYLSKLASDLAASGMGDYQSNIEALSSLMLGRFRSAAAQFGINIKENTDAFTILQAIEGKVSLTTEQLANSAPGQANKWSTAWKEALGSIGRGFVGFLEGWTDLTQRMILGDKYIDDLHKYQQEVAKLSDDTNKKAAEAAAKATQNADEQGKAQEKASEAYRDFAKNVVQAFEEQEKAIASLRKEMTDLDQQLSDSLTKSNDKYKADVTNLARSAQDKVVSLDKQIADEKAHMSAGWRTRVEQLEKQKAAEQSIIERAGGQVANLKDELAKDDLTRLEEAHQKELKEIKDSAEQKRLELYKEELQRQVDLLTIQKNLRTPGYINGAVNNGQSFLGSIGASPTQQQFIFNFNGDVSDIDKLKQAVIDALNRQATLRGVGGK